MFSIVFIESEKICDLIQNLFKFMVLCVREMLYINFQIAFYISEIIILYKLTKK